MKKLISTLLACVFLWQAMPLNVIAEAVNPFPTAQELSAALDEAVTLAALEDLYRPYKPKRRTRASMAKEKGLGPLADLLYAQELREGELLALAAEYINEEKGVSSAADALAGASDIIAEGISDNAELRKFLRELLGKIGLLNSLAAKEEDSVYRLYYEFSQPI